MPLKGTSDEEHRLSSPRVGARSGHYCLQLTRCLESCGVSPARSRTGVMGKAGYTSSVTEQDGDWLQEAGGGAAPPCFRPVQCPGPPSPAPGTPSCFLLPRDLERLQGHWLAGLGGSVPGALPLTPPSLRPLHWPPPTPGQSPGLAQVKTEHLHGGFCSSVLLLWVDLTNPPLLSSPLSLDSSHRDLQAGLF